MPISLLRPAFRFLNPFIAYRLLYGSFLLETSALWSASINGWIAAQVTGKLSIKAVCQAFGTTQSLEFGSI